MTKEELLTKLRAMRYDITGESGWHHGMLSMVCQLQDWAHTLPDDPTDEPEPPKKARRVELKNTGGYWRWKIWQEDEPGSWGKVFSMTMGYASIAEAAELAERWLRNNP